MIRSRSLDFLAVELPPINSFLLIPDDVIQKKFSIVKDPRISAVCQIWNKINNSLDVYYLILADYRNENSLKYYIDHLPELMERNETIKNIKDLFCFINKKIKQNGIQQEALMIQRELKTTPLELYPLTRYIEDTALIDSCTFEGFQICEKLNAFAKIELEKQLSVTETATSIREWMKVNPKAFAEFTKIKIKNEHEVNDEMNVTDETKLKLIVAEIGLFYNLKKLNLTAKDLFISSEICKLTNLKKLNICAENVYFPKSISLLTNLNRLCLSNGFLAYPKLLGKFVNLRKMELYDIQSLKKLPKSLGQLVHLNKLAFYDNTALETLPESIGLLTNLTTLICSRYDQEDYRSFNELKNLPESIGNLINLTKLNLRFHSLPNIPESIGKLTKLKYLDLDSAKSWDYRVDKLFHCAELIITAYEQAITNWWNLEIPPHVYAYLENFSQLIIEHWEIWANNEGEIIYSGSKATAIFIGQVQLFLNSIIQNIPSAEKNELNIFINFREDFKKFVKDYDTSFPGEGRIRQLPNSMGNLKNLTYLNIKNNHLKILPISLKGFLNTIHTLEITGNPLENLSRDDWFNMSTEVDFDNIQEEIM
ncbi:MAG: hypothetical protein H0U27_00710 [Nitrosopumilus sp.]|nr:hypothetical protein [Nitrosopumilus sp.]